MKGIIIIDVPVNEAVEIDEMDMTADLKVYPTLLTNREDLFFELENVEVRPMPERLHESRAMYGESKDYIVGTYIDKYAVGWNACLDEMIGEEQ